MPTRAPPAYDPGVRAAWLLVLTPTLASAGTLVGKLELPPPPERPEPPAKGFVDRFENPLAPVKGFSVAPELVVELLGDEKPAAPPQIVWRLVGESFERSVIAAPAGAEIVIKDDSKIARTLVAKEDPKLVPPGPINPGGTKPFRVNEAGKVYSIGDPDAPHLRGTIIVVNTLYIGYPDESGRYEITDVAPGSYKLRVWYGGKLLDRPDDDVTVSAKGKTNVDTKIPAGYPVRK